MVGFVWPMTRSAQFASSPSTPPAFAYNAAATSGYALGSQQNMTAAQQQQYLAAQQNANSLTGASTLYYNTTSQGLGSAGPTHTALVVIAYEGNRDAVTIHVDEFRLMKAMIKDIGDQIANCRKSEGCLNPESTGDICVACVRNKYPEFAKTIVENTANAILAGNKP